MNTATLLLSGTSRRRVEHCCSMREWQADSISSGTSKPTAGAA
jgi:hypothetical protein